jgi:hypothetical protein
MRSPVRGKHRFSVFESKMLRRTFQPTRQEKENYGETCTVRSFTSQFIYVFYVNKSARMRIMDYVVHIWKTYVCNKNLVENYEGKRPHRRSRLVWNIMLKWILHKSVVKT